ncbi:UDP-D-galactose:(glucosyl)lipopolysaccharide-1,6-D-galactosyltransferase (plasmid) [Roseivivax sp. THAF40]|uniref:glycosyltransferase family 4 protein n=1 Tax=Roseivivax sp. THAF40 TaxID=2587858 RepID=UPI001267C43E|nr:glycosyltransferase [Roseivivax sp. THAF40]QFT48730.1 UDP-D-galactose:(glucosyl)lipopolysaccharide-1,6-D-galactosyltransferase [Roseivivax sp. THAF40]
MEIIFLQPALPSYRIDFFKRLSDIYGERFHLYYSPSEMGVLTEKENSYRWATQIGQIKSVLKGAEWQVGALSIPIKRNSIFVVCGAPRTISTIFVLVKAKLSGAKTVWWGQYWSASSTKSRHRIRMMLSRLADALLFYTDAELDRFRKDGAKHTGTLGALNNGIDLSEIHRLREPFDPRLRSRNIMFIGRLTEKAQLQLAIDALASPALLDAHLHVVGSGMEESALRSRVAALGLSNKVTWHGGTTDERLIAKVANRCAAFVYPGQVGLSLIHAMGYGLPCVVHNQPLRHMPEIGAFKNGCTGETFEEGDAKSLANSIDLLLKNKSALVRMSSRCCEITAHDYSTENMAARFKAFAKRVEAKC